MFLALVAMVGSKNSINDPLLNSTLLNDSINENVTAFPTDSSNEVTIKLIIVYNFLSSQPI